LSNAAPQLECGAQSGSWRWTQADALKLDDARPSKLHQRPLSRETSRRPPGDQREQFVLAERLGPYPFQPLSCLPFRRRGQCGYLDLRIARRLSVARFSIRLALLGDDEGGTASSRHIRVFDILRLRRALLGRALLSITAVAAAGGAVWWLLCRK
jgi:hypothetical protein